MAAARQVACVTFETTFTSYRFDEAEPTEKPIRVVVPPPLFSSLTLRVDVNLGEAVFSRCVSVKFAGEMVTPQGTFDVPYCRATSVVVDARRLLARATRVEGGGDDSDDDDDGGDEDDNATTRIEDDEDDVSCRLPPYPGQLLHGSQ
jgi:hypothetical protein